MLAHAIAFFFFPLTHLLASKTIHPFANAYEVHAHRRLSSGRGRNAGVCTGVGATKGESSGEGDVGSAHVLCQTNRPDEQSF